MSICAVQITHMPPELINEGKMSKAVDVYGFGVLLWEVRSCTAPDPMPTPHSSLTAGIRCTDPHCSRLASAEDFSFTHVESM